MPLQSFCVQLEDVKNESGNVFQQLYRSFKILQDTLCFSTLLVILSVHLIGMCGYGIAYLRSCPMEPKIPVYLVVGGLTGLYKVLLLFFDESKMRHDDYHKPVVNTSTGSTSVLSRINGRSAATSVLHKTLDIFLSIWFVLGNVWILRHVRQWSGQISSPNSNKYNKMLKLASLCETKIYAFALTHLVFCYVLLATAVMYVIIVLLVTRKFRSKCFCTCV